MKIAYVLSSLNPGGAEGQTVKIVREAVQRGHQVIAVLVNGAGHMPGNLQPQLAATGAVIVDLVTWLDKGAAIQQVLEDLRPDVMQAVGYPLTLVAAIAARRADVPVIVIRYESTGHARDQFPQPEALEREAHGLATFLTGNSWAVSDSIKTLPGVGPDRVRVVQNGVDIPADVTRRAGQPVVLGQLANFRADGLKNQLMTVRAMRYLGDLDVTAVLAGYGSEYQAEVEAEAMRLGVADRVLFPGRLSDLSALHDWDIALNTSHTEGLSNAVMECMAYGLPVVATRVGGNPELVSKTTGLLVDDDDDAALAAAIRELVLNPDRRRRLGQTARNWIRANYNWDEIMARWEALYEEGLKQ